MNEPFTGVIELIRPRDRAHLGRAGERFGPGERIIVVNGVRWGRTIVQSQGRVGRIVRFHQDGGDILIMEPGPIGPFRAEVRPVKFRRLHRNDNRTTEEVVLDKARELVSAGLLRDPIVVRNERAEARAEWQSAITPDQIRHRLKFRFRAAEALVPISQQLDVTTYGIIIERVVKAMEWAQTE
jgi:hypothetical protein